MTYIITKLCRDCGDIGGVALWPVDCLYESGGEEREPFPAQLYLHPEEGIDWGACEPQCPWQASFEEVAVPQVFSDDSARNDLRKDQGAAFKVPPDAKKPHPTADEVEANKRKGGWTGCHRGRGVKLRPLPFCQEREGKG